MAHDHDRRRGLERWQCLIEPIVDSYDERRSNMTERNEDMPENKLTVEQWLAIPRKPAC